MSSGEESKLSVEAILTALRQGLERIAFLERVRRSYHVVVIPDDNNIRVESFETLDELVESLRCYLQQESPPTAVPFMGMPLPITKPPNRQLRTPVGLIPLELMPSPVDEDDFEWNLASQPLPRMPTAAEPIVAQAHDVVDDADDARSLEDELDDDSLFEADDSDHIDDDSDS